MAHERGLRERGGIVIREVQRDALLAAIGRVGGRARLFRAFRFRARAGDRRPGYPALEDGLVRRGDRGFDPPRQIHCMVVLGMVGNKLVLVPPGYDTARDATIPTE